MPPQIYVTVFEDLHDTAQIYAKKEGVTFILAVVLFSPPWKLIFQIW